MPSEIGDARPVLLMLATLGTLDVHAAVVVTSCIVPSENVTEAVNCAVWSAESEMLVLFGFTVSPVMVLSLTVISAVAVTLLLLDFAVIVVVPNATAVARPELSMVAMLGEEDCHVT